MPKHPEEVARQPDPRCDMVGAGDNPRGYIVEAEPWASEEPIRITAETFGWAFPE